MKIQWENVKTRFKKTIVDRLHFENPSLILYVFLFVYIIFYKLNFNAFQYIWDEYFRQAI